MAIDDGGAAFPRAGYEYQDEEGGRLELACEAQDGLSLRDYFAAKAIQTLRIEVPKNASDIDEAVAEGARISYLLADAMLKERAKPCST